MQKKKAPRSMQKAWKQNGQWQNNCGSNARSQTKTSPANWLNDQIACYKEFLSFF
jgi:hypothetical protein